LPNRSITFQSAQSVQELKRENIPVIAIDPQGDKAMRMNAQTDRGRLIFLPKVAGWLDDFRGEILPFPAGRYTDQIDALSQALDRAFTQCQREMGVGIIGLGGRMSWLDDRGRAFDASRNGCIPSGRQ
jgi:hypothetical protein